MTGHVRSSSSTFVSRSIPQMTFSEESVMTHSLPDVAQSVTANASASCSVPTMFVPPSRWPQRIRRTCSCEIPAAAAIDRSECSCAAALIVFSRTLRAEVALRAASVTSASLSRLPGKEHLRLTVDGAEQRPDAQDAGEAQSLRLGLRDALRVDRDDLACLAEDVVGDGDGEGVTEHLGLLGRGGRSNRLH